MLSMPQVIEQSLFLFEHNLLWHPEPRLSDDVPPAVVLPSGQDGHDQGHRMRRGKATFFKKMMNFKSIIIIKKTKPFGGSEVVVVDWTDAASFAARPDEPTGNLAWRNGVRFPEK